MNILLFYVSSRNGAGVFMIPSVLLQVDSIVEHLGHKAKIVDPYLFDEGGGSNVKDRIDI